MIIADDGDNEDDDDGDNDGDDGDNDDDDGDRGPQWRATPSSFTDE